MKNGSSTSMKFTRFTVFAVVASLLLLVANAALWFNRYIFDTQQFTQVTQTAILSESSRQALAGTIVDNVLQNRPLLKNVIDQQATAVIAGLLNSSPSQQLLQRTISVLQTTITSSNPQPVTIDLSALRQGLSGILGVFRQQAGISPEEQVINEDDIPATITLLNPENLPNIYVLGVVVMWTGFLAFVAAVVLFAEPLYRVWRNRVQLMRLLMLQAVFVAAACVVGLLLGPLLKPLVVGSVANPNARTVLENIYNAFVGYYNAQTVMLFWIAGVWLLVAAILYFVPFIRRKMRA